MCEKALNKEVVEEIKQQKQKEREDKKVKQVVDSFDVAERAVQKLAKKLTRTNFMLVWFIVAIREARDRFHKKIAMGFRVIV